MSQFTDNREQIRNLTTDLEKERKQLHKTRISIRNRQEILETARRQKDQDLVDQTTEQINTLKEDFHLHESRIIELNGQIIPIADVISTPESIKDNFGELDGGIPVVLFPVRTEVRFKAIQDGNNTFHQLWVRVYPDDIAIDTHEEELTEDEVKAGQIYWLGNIKQSQDPRTKVEEFIGPWRTLARAYGPERAAWIAKETNQYEIQGAGEVTDADVVFTYDREKKADAWSRAPESRVMPDRFMVKLYKKGKEPIEAVGNLIPDQLIVGPDPVKGVEEGGVEGEFTDTFGDVDGKLVVDPEMEWMVNFDKAVQAGMGLKINIPADRFNEGFDRLVVFGLKLSLDKQDAKKRIENLLDTHHFSDEGFSLIPNGSRTNNIDDHAAGFSRFGVDEEVSLDVERKNPLISEDIAPHIFDQKDGEILADLLGVDRRILYHIQYSDHTDISETSYMKKTLWNATLGYFMDEMLDGVFTGEDIDHTRAFFNLYLSGRGMIPSIRVGDQPYGILPVTNFKNLNFPADLDINIFHTAATHLPSTHPPFFSYLNRLHHVLKRMEEDWKSMSEKVSYVGKGESGYQSLLDILSLHASSVEYHNRFAAGANYVINLLNMKQLNYASVRLWDYLLRKGLDILRSLGYETRKTLPPIFEKIFYEEATKLNDIKNVIDSKTPSETDTIEEYNAGKNYILWLAENDMDLIRKQDFGEGVDRPTALLYLMLRHSLMLHNAEAANRLALAQNITRDTYKDKEFLYVENNSPYQGKFGQLILPLQNITAPDQPLEKYLQIRDNLPLNPETFSLSDHLEALDKLAGLPTARLERLFAETIDLCSYRLDAWKSGLVHFLSVLKRRIREGDEIRTRKGLYLGAYGWLEDLKPQKLDIEEITSPPSEFEDAEKPLFKDPDNGGHIFSPSLGHGVTAAVLRSAHLNNSDPGNPDAFEINFSSERVRTAISYIEGINNGQSIESLLGYQFERGLHDRHSLANILDTFIYPLRQQFPLYSGRLTEVDENENIETVEARNVVNGYDLIVHYRAHKGGGFPFDINAFSSANTQERAALTDELDRLADSMDAVYDVLMADSVYGAALGNADRTAGVLDFIGAGKSVPFPEIPRTPRTGYALTHRVAIHFQAIPKNDRFNEMLWNPFQPDLPFTPRAKAEPAVNKWLSEVLPAPAKIFTHVSYSKAGADQKMKVTLKDLALQPIDLVYTIGNGTGEDMMELDTRIAFFVRSDKNLMPDDRVTLQYTVKKDTDPADEVSFFELMPMLRSLRDLVISSRPSKSDDMVPSSEGQEIPDDFVRHDTDELDHRATQIKSLFDPVKAAFDAKLAELENNVNDPAVSPNASGEIKPMMFALNAFNVKRALPEYPGNEADEVKNKELLNLAKSYSSRTQEIVDHYTSHYTVFTGAADEATRVTALSDCITSLMGTEFTVLPNFHIYNKTEFGNSYVQHNQMLSSYDDAFPMDTWMDGLARVRPKMESLENAYLMADNFDRTIDELLPVQLPYLENDTWLGGKLPLDYIPDGDKLLYSSVYTHALNTNELQTGLIIDEWTEIIPTEIETAGLAFHYDQPNSEPPQSVLLSFSPSFHQNWNWDDLEESVLQALEMAKLRAVDPDLIAQSGYSQLLPSIMVAVTRYLITASTNFAVNINAQIVDTHG